MKRLLALAAVVSFATLAFCDETAKPITYQLRIPQYADTFVKTPEFVFVIGDVAYRSFERLRDAVSRLPRGSTLEWAQGLSEKQEQELKAACKSAGLQFVHVPSG